MAEGATFAAAASLGAAAAASLALYAGLSDASQLFGEVLVAPPLPHQVALTFDDGPNPLHTPRLLAVLAKRKVRATFFMIGDYVIREPALVREVAAQGHRIGNHTMTHPWLPRHPDGFIREQILRCSAALEAALGSPVGLFRPPHGARRPAVLRMARNLGLTTVQWNLIVGDWKDRPADELARRMERGIAGNQRRQRGTTIVLHDGSQRTPSANRQSTIDAVEILLDRLPPATEFVVPPDWDSSRTPALVALP